MPIHSTITCTVKMLSKRRSLSSSVFCFVSGQAAMVVFCRLWPDTEQWETGLSWSVASGVLRKTGAGIDFCGTASASAWCSLWLALFVPSLLSAQGAVYWTLCVSSPAFSLRPGLFPSQSAIRPKAVYRHHRASLLSGPRLCTGITEASL